MLINSCFGDLRPPKPLWSARSSLALLMLSGPQQKGHSVVSWEEAVDGSLVFFCEGSNVGLWDRVCVCNGTISLVRVGKKWLNPFTCCMTSLNWKFWGESSWSAVLAPLNNDTLISVFYVYWLKVHSLFKLSRYWEDSKCGPGHVWPVKCHLYFITISKTSVWEP